MSDKLDLYTDDLSGTYIGIIEDTDDPLFEGRCKIRVYSKYDTIPLDDIPWASPVNNMQFAGNNGFGNLSVPKKGTVVHVIFANKNLYQPEYYTIQNINSDLYNELKNSYENATSLVWDSDENLKIWYTKAKGLTISCKDSKIQIQPNSTILLEHKESQSMIELAGANITITSDSKISVTAGSEIDLKAPTINVTGNKTNIGANPIFSAISAEPLWTFLNALSAAVDAKYPMTPGVLTSAASIAQEASTSKTVKTTP